MQRLNTISDTKKFKIKTNRKKFVKTIDIYAKSRYNIVCECKNIIITQSLIT